MTPMPPATQNKSDALYEVRRSNIDGSGAFALKNIPKGTRIDEYVGERISNAEADRRYRDHEMDSRQSNRGKSRYLRQKEEDTTKTRFSAARSGD